MSENTENAEYESYGDVNPLIHGGIWVKQSGVNEYDIIRFNPESNEIADLLVNVGDTWIDKAGVMSFIGMTEESFNPVMFAIGATDYYSHENFGSTYPDQTKEDVNEFLKCRGIEI